MTQEKVQVPMAKAQALTLLLTAGAFLLEALLFLLIRGGIPPLHVGVLGFFLVPILGIFAHEAIHGLAFLIFGKASWKDIRFGILWKYLTPYCHCQKPLTRRAYRISLWAPAVILGLLPMAVGLILPSSGWGLFGVFFFGAAGGDLALDHAVKKAPPDARLLDHPSELGFFILSD